MDRWFAGSCERVDWRVTYRLAPQRRIVLLTVFRKTRSADTTQTVISRLEGGAVTPTLPLLHRLAGALDANGA